MSQLPTIGIVRAPKDVNVAEYFNSAFNGEQPRSEYYDAYCFLPYGIEFNEEYALMTVSKVFHTYPQVSCVYADSSNASLLYPSWNYTTCDTFAINSVLCCRKNLELRFDPEYVELCAYEFLKRLSKKHLAWHIARPLFTAPTSTNDQVLQMEMHRITDEQSN